MNTNTKCEKFEELNEKYKRSCLDATKIGINSMVNKFIDYESIDSDYKPKIINMMVTLLTLNRRDS